MSQKDISNPKYPIYIPSKGRYKKALRKTSTYFDKIGIDYKLVVEPEEYDNYLNEVKDENKLLLLDMEYKENYETCDEHGTSRPTGSGPARNFIWDHAISIGSERHWCMDDNIRGFRRMNNNRKIKVENGSLIRAMEDFVDRYKNVGMAGPHYDYFFPSRVVKPPFLLNSRIYSCNLIKNDLDLRWRGRHNEDTILSLDVLKQGWCTVLFNVFLQEKQTTMTMKGGNTDEFYKHDSRLYVTQLLKNTHPDVTEVTKRYNRWHHKVDYSGFNQKLVRRENIQIKKGVNNYGMKLQPKTKNG
jgi:hypothetical protein